MSNEKPYILIVEDDPQFVNLLDIYLQKLDYQIIISRNGKEALELVKNFSPDIIISDIMMPEMDGLAFRHHLLRDPELRLIPFIFLSAKGRTEERITGLKLSVDDYITKPFEPEELIARIQSILDRHKLYRDLIKYDSLTHLYNRRTLEGRLKNELSRVRRYNLDLSILFVDIDNFKTFNDTHGHAFGDYVIIMVAEKLLSEFRDVDFAGRLGGDEFVVVMPETSKENCHMVAERLRQSLAELELDKKDVHISISGGVSSAPADGLSVEELFEKADTALYEAKRQGRSRIIKYNTSLEGDPPE